MAASFILTSAPPFIAQESRDWGSARGDAWDAFLAESGQEASDQLRETFNTQYEAEHGGYLSQPSNRRSIILITLWN